MTVLRMDHAGIVVEDLAAAIAFFRELGLEVVGETTVGGQRVDRIIGFDGSRSDIAVLQTPDGHSRLELSHFVSPVSPPGGVSAAANHLGLRHLAFAVDDIHGTLDRLRPYGPEFVFEVVEYGDGWHLCYLRGPADIIIELAERRGGSTAAEESTLQGVSSRTPPAPKI